MDLLIPTWGDRYSGPYRTDVFHNGFEVNQHPKIAIASLYFEVKNAHLSTEFLNYFLSKCYTIRVTLKSPIYFIKIDGAKPSRGITR